MQRDKAELVKNIDSALLALKPQIAELSDKYGFPKALPVRLDLVATGGTPANVQSIAARSNSVVVPAQWMIKTADVSGDKPQSKTKPKHKNSASTGSTATKAAAGVAAAGAITQVAAEKAPPLSDAAQLGRVRFNDQCSHCHGSDGATPIRERDVRRLKMRYDAKWLETATTTIKNGRSDLGMPPWKDTLKEPEIQQLLSFLETVQK